jgi:hypothetical protein
LKFCLVDANRADFELGKVLIAPLLGAIALWLAWRMSLRELKALRWQLF